MAKNITKTEATKAAKVITAYTKQEAAKKGKTIASTAKSLSNKAFTKLKKYL